jgi:predicted GIY-YIG superfamily endonuclease
MTTQEAFKRIREVHGDKYTLEDGWEYKNANSDIVLFCKDHGEFHKSFYRLVNLRQGCPVCSTGVYSKPPSFWNNYNNCLDEARKYRNKFELQKKCCGCYQGLRRNHWLNEVASKFYDNSIHYMKYDEKINCVYAYEFDEWKTFYVGRTNNIKRRDRQHRNGCGHRDGTREFDSVYRFAEECGVDIPKPIILEENLNAADSQKMEDEWKKRYIETG